MILNHVADDAGAVVVAAARLHPHRLGRRDLDVVDVPRVPQRREHPVGQPEGKQILDRLLPEIVIDAVDLLLPPVLQERLIQGPGRGEIPAERLLDDDPLLPRHPGEAGGIELLVDQREEIGGDRQIEERIAGGANLRTDTVDLRPEAPERLVIVEVTDDVMEPRLKPGPSPRIDGLPRAKLRDLPALLLPKLLRRHLEPPHADDRE